MARDSGLTGWFAAGALALAVTIFAGCLGGDGHEEAPWFGPPVVTELGADRAKITLADFNGDGRTDVLFVRSDGSVNVMLGNGNATFQPARISTAVPQVRSIAVGDLNGDRVADLAIAASPQGAGAPFEPTLFVMLGRGDGTFATPAALPASSMPSTATAVAIADFDRDGHADLAVGRAGSTTLSSLPGRGDGTFGAPVAWPVDPNDLYWSAAKLSVADMNGDGSPDLVAWLTREPESFLSTYGIAVLIGRGDGTFEPPRIQHTRYSLTYLDIADFNGDLRPDVIYNGDWRVYPRYGGPGTITILQGKGDGTFSNESNPAYPPESWVASFAAGDVNRDGSLDLVVRPSDTTDLSILIGKGDGGFEPALTHALTLGAASIHSLKDVNADGRLDLVLVTSTAIAVLPGKR